jgi:hypothetical protein
MVLTFAKKTILHASRHQYFGAIIAILSLRRISSSGAAFLPLNVFTFEQRNDHYDPSSCLVVQQLNTHEQKLASTTSATVKRKKSLFPRTKQRSISSCTIYMGKPNSGSIVDSYQTVSVNCKKCRTRLFRYKKKNGTKSNLVKCYVERISEDCQGIVAERQCDGIDDDGTSNSESPDWICPNCDTRFGRDALIHGRPAIKLIGGKVQMTKK